MVILWIDADAIYDFGHFVGERSSYEGVCMEGADGGINGHTCFDTMRPQILM